MNIEAEDKFHRTAIFSTFDAFDAFHAAYRGKSSGNTTKILLEGGANVEARDIDGKSVLHYVVGVGLFWGTSAVAAKMLVEAGALITPEIWEMIPPEFKQYADRKLAGATHNY